MNILFQEWGNRGLHYWEVGDTNIDLIEGQAEYTFYRASGDGTSSVTVGGTSGSSTYGIADILEATYRTGRTETTQADSTLTKIARSAYSALANKLSKGTPSQYFVQRFVDKTTLTVYPTADSTAASKRLAYFLCKKNSRRRCNIHGCNRCTLSIRSLYGIWIIFLFGAEICTTRSTRIKIIIRR